VISAHHLVHQPTTVVATRVVLLTQAATIVRQALDHMTVAVIFALVVAVHI